ncbi:MAG: thioredoxin family protein [Chthoniobacterales bacterium]
MKTCRLAFLALAFCSLSLASARAEADWMTDLGKAQAEAKASHKLLLLDFTGSDWCGWCKLLHAEVFSQPKFKDYARKNLVLMTVDFPRSTPMTSEVRQQNQALARKYGIQGFPTIVVLNGEGKQVGELGYVRGGPDAFLQELEKVPKG